MTIARVRTRAEIPPQKSYEFEITLAPPITLANRNAYKVEGTCSNKDKGVITLSVGALPPQQITCDQNYRWQLTIDVSEINTGEEYSHYSHGIG